MKEKNDSSSVDNNGWEKLYEDGKAALTDCYQNLIYFQNFNVYDLLTLAIRKQNHRIYTVLPPKTRKIQVTLKPITRTSSTDFKKCHSIDVQPLNQDKITDLLNKKLAKKEKKKQLLTEKRMEERKIKKRKPLTFKELYGILNVR